MKHAVRVAAWCVLALGLSPAAWAQWSSDPAQNLDLSNIPGADQVQPKLLSLSDNTWYVSWFNNNPNDPPPRGYDVYYQYLSANGVEQLPHDGIQVAKLTLSSTEDYGAAVDSSGKVEGAFGCCSAPAAVPKPSEPVTEEEWIAASQGCCGARLDWPRRARRGSRSGRRGGQIAGSRPPWSHARRGRDRAT